jgi:DNA-binding NtrC family response regulator
VSSTTAATILVFEESAAVQELIDQALRDCGHRVLSTGNALEALDVVRRVRIDVVVDVGALHESGRRRLIQELGSIQPGVQVVSICGPEDDLDTDHGGRLSSPLSLEDLGEAVSVELDRRGHL